MTANFQFCISCVEDFTFMYLYGMIGLQRKVAIKMAQDYIDNFQSEAFSDGRDLMKQFIDDQQQIEKMANIGT